MKFTTALRAYARKRVETLEKADIVVGIPSYNNFATIAEVVKTVSVGLSRYFPQSRSVIVVSDGGSTDDTREEARDIQIKPFIEKMVTIYRGVPGKGSALRGIFEIAHYLEADICIVCDADLRSITPEWIRNLARPIQDEGYQFVAPYYKRHKYDGTITNNIVYNFTRALYGYRIRQPIGGDFGLSKDVVKFCLDQDVWETDVGRFGIDIWLTTISLVHKFRVCQARLGAKIHDVKDPSESLGPMFSQVVTTLFRLMEQYQGVWKELNGSQPVEILGRELLSEPESFEINVPELIERFKTGFGQFGSLWKTILEKESFQQVEEAAKLDEENFIISTELWVKLLYELASTFHHWETNRYKLINLMTPLYFARIASFVNETRDMTDEEAEAAVEKQAEKFEEEKPYLIERWEK